MKIVALLFSLLILISCKNNPPSANEQNKQDTIAGEVKDTSLCRLVVRFSSDGTGADFPSINAFEDSIGSFSNYFNKQAIDYRKNNWGPEGETYFCLKLNELSQAEQNEFVSKTRNMLKNARVTNIHENYPCPNISSYRKK